MPFSSGNLRNVRQSGMANFVYFFVVAALLVGTTVTPAVNGRICTDIDIRNDLKSAEKLRNCTVIIGSLSIVLIEKANHTEINNLKFPELKEITGYLLMYRVFGLKSLRNLFPNLTVIRGERLITHYALIIYELTNLTEIGLSSLIKIQRGYVMIKLCPMLCYMHTIDWEAITQARIGNSVTNHLNSDQYNMPFAIQCPLSCPDTCPTKNCWNNKSCQLFDTGNSNTVDNLQCHEECLGDCSDGSASGCQVCRHLRTMYLVDQKIECVRQCPPNLYAWSSICVDVDFCRKQGKKPVFGECRDSCPLIIIEKSDPMYAMNSTVCAKDCPGIEVESLATSDLLRGCQIINGDINIRLKLGMADTMQTLERNLGDIEEINGILKVYRSPVVTSLSFFRSLRIIRGNSSSENNKFTLVIMENENLVELFGSEKQSLQLSRGNLLVHYNSKLCPNQIIELQKLLKTNVTADFIGTESNGYETTCLAKAIATSTKLLSSSSVEIVWNKIDVRDTEKIVGYIVYYIVAPTRNVSRIGIDTCVQYGWQTHFIQNFTDDASRSSHSATIENLTQNTQYAYYVKAQVVPKDHEDELLGVTQGLSNIQYFQTLADVPTCPFVETLSKTSSSLTLVWTPTDDNDLIESYKVDVFIQPDEHELLDQRDYCVHPRIETHVSVGVEVPSTTAYQNCSTEFENWKLANPDSPDPEYYWLIHRKAECAERNSRQSKEQNQSQISKYVNNHKINDCADGKNCKEQTRFRRQIHGMFSKDGFGYKRDDKDGKLGKYHISQHFYNADQLNTTFDGLLPYTMYIFQFFSCNKIDCSTYFLHYDRTDSSATADNIPSFSATVDSNNPNTVHLEFTEPPTPNGLTVAFQIQKHDWSDYKITTHCIPWKEYIANGKRFTFEHLEKGQYIFSVRSVSLALSGAYTAEQFVSIYGSSISTVVIVGIVFICLLFAFLIGTLIIYLYRHMGHRMRNRSLNTSTQNILMQMDEGETAQDDDIPSFYQARTDDHELF